jgi:lipoyl(octanoyl) transferase
VPAALQPRGARAPAPSLSPCFQQPVEGEVVARGAQAGGERAALEGGVLLQHGSLPMEDDQSLIPLLLGGRGLRPAAPPATLAALLGAPPAWEALTAALAAGWEEALGVELRPDGLSGGGARAAALRGRYEDPAWTWHGTACLRPPRPRGRGTDDVTREGKG